MKLFRAVGDASFAGRGHPIPECITGIDATRGEITAEQLERTTKRAKAMQITPVKPEEELAFVR